MEEDEDAFGGVRSGWEQDEAKITQQSTCTASPHKSVTNNTRVLCVRINLKSSQAPDPPALSTGRVRSTNMQLFLWLRDENPSEIPLEG